MTWDCFNLARSEETFKGIPGGVRDDLFASYGKVALQLNDCNPKVDAL